MIEPNSGPNKWQPQGCHFFFAATAFEQILTSGFVRQSEILVCVECCSRLCGFKKFITASVLVAQLIDFFQEFTIDADTGIRPT